MVLVARYWFRPRALSIGDAANQGSVQFSGTNTNTGSTTLVNGVTFRGPFTGRVERGLSLGRQWHSGFKWVFQ
jgi:hypothetical protein